MTADGGGWTLCANFVDTAGDDIVSTQTRFNFGGDWSGYNGTIPTNTASKTSSGSLNCQTWATYLTATQARVDCTASANSASGSASWSSGALPVTLPATFADVTLGSTMLTTHGEWAWGGYGRGSWVADDAAYPNCGGNSCGTDGSRFASSINVELAGGYYSPGCASGCGSHPQNYTGSEEGASCGGTSTTGVAGERYSFWLR